MVIHKKNSVAHSCALIVFGLQWSSMVQRNTIYQAYEIHTTLVRRTHSFLVWVLSLDLMTAVQ